MGRVIVDMRGDKVEVYNTENRADIILLGPDGNNRVFSGPGLVPPEVWRAAKDAWDKIHDPDYKAGRSK